MRVSGSDSKRAEVALHYNFSVDVSPESSRRDSVIFLSAGREILNEIFWLPRYSDYVRSSRIGSIRNCPCKGIALRIIHSGWLGG